MIERYMDRGIEMDRNWNIWVVECIDADREIQFV